MVLDRVSTPIVLAPLAGGPSTPELAAAVTDGGGLGFLAAGYLSAGELKARAEEARDLTDGPIGINLFVPGGGPTPPDHYQGYVDELGGWARGAGQEVGEATYNDDEWDAKLAQLHDHPVAVAAFTFGCPESGAIASLQAVGTEVWVSITSPDEAREAAAAGADALIVQGAEAGGHRASFVDRPGAPIYALLPLLALVGAEVDLPLIATGGIATGRAVAAVMAAGAKAAQIGTAFMLAPEAGTSDVHRDALQSSRPTELTRAFTGRLARGIRNEFMATHPDAPVAYPEIHYVTAPMRRRAREDGNAELINLWAGEAHELAEARPAAEIVELLSP